MYRLLVLDDEESFRAALRGYLERSGYAVEEADNSRESLEDVTRDGIDLVIIHLQTGRKADLETIGLVRELNEEVPVIALSSSPMALRDALSRGANFALKKPFDPDDLLIAVRILLTSGV